MAFDSGKGGCRECKMPCSCAQIVLLEVVGRLSRCQEYVSVNAASVGTCESTAEVIVLSHTTKQRRGICNMLNGCEK